MPALLPPRQTTAKELFEFTGDGYRYELISVNLAMLSLAGSRHGLIAFRLAQLLGAHVESNALGVVFADETGF